MRPTAAVRPPAAVLDAFGVNGPAVRLPGGQRTAWRAGGLVLKPLDMPREAVQWLDQVARARAAGSALRLSLPVEDTHGRLVVDGWTAFPYWEGTHATNRWSEIADVARAFSSAFDGVDRPHFISARTDPWARADRFAWSEEVLSGAAAVPGVPDLVRARKPVAERSGIMHGDLAGNVLFDPVEPPAVIDLSLYWRPAEYAVAIVAADAASFHGADPSAVRSADPGFPQYLLRALLFRMVTEWLNGKPLGDFAGYRDPVRQALVLAGR